MINKTHTMFGLLILHVCNRKEGKLPRLMEFQFFIRLMQLLGCHLPWQQGTSSPAVDAELEDEEDRDHSHEDSLGSEWGEAADRLDAISQTLCQGSGFGVVSEAGVLESILGCVKELLEYDVYQVNCDY